MALDGLLTLTQTAMSQPTDNKNATAVIVADDPECESRPISLV